MTFSIQRSIEILEQTPKTLNQFLSNLSDDWILYNEGENTWSAFDVVGHLLHGEKTDWITRLNIILTDDVQKTFSVFDRFAQFENSKGKNMQQLLDEFSELRSKNITYLKSLNISEHNLNCKGKHPNLGDVTLKQLLATWVVHDLGHIAQISRVMAKQYKTEVGPWEDYLAVLNR